MLMKIAFVALVAGLSAIDAAVASAKCGACMMLINELEAGIASVDPKKMIAVGSFRVDGKGNQKGLNEIPYGRSESHLVELLENVCEKSSNYVTVQHPVTGKYVFVKRQTADGLKLKSDSSSTSKLANACSDFLDLVEDDLVEFLKVTHDDAVRSFCVDRRACTSVDVTAFPVDFPQSEDSEEEVNDEL